MIGGGGGGGLQKPDVGLDPISFHLVNLPYPELKYKI